MTSWKPPYLPWNIYYSMSQKFHVDFGSPTSESSSRQAPWGAAAFTSLSVLPCTSIWSFSWSKHRIPGLGDSDGVLGGILHESNNLTYFHRQIYREIFHKNNGNLKDGLGIIVAWTDWKSPLPVFEGRNPTRETLRIWETRNCLRFREWAAPNKCVSSHLILCFQTVFLPSGIQTWQWKIPPFIYLYIYR